MPHAFHCSLNPPVYELVVRDFMIQLKVVRHSSINLLMAERAHRSVYSASFIHLLAEMIIRVRSLWSPSGIHGGANGAYLHTLNKFLPGMELLLPYLLLSLKGPF